MSKVIHLSDQAHNNAKNFCKQHGLKMSDWVADLIVDAILTNRVDPRSPSRSAPAPTSSSSSTSTSTVPPASTTASAKKKLERFVDNGSGAASSNADDVETGPEAPPWSAPPFWAKSQK